jgi:hypothetical protein
VLHTHDKLKRIGQQDRANIMSKNLFSILVFTVLVTGCSHTKPALVEAPPAYQPVSSDTQLKLPTLGSAKLPEVQDAVRRVFKDSAVIDPNAKPSFFVGDFNGDDSQDLAVVIKAADGKLADMNQEYPSWLLRDPTIDSSSKRLALNVTSQEELLAIIHGFGNNNWRDPQATQTFLLKNVVGSNMSVVNGKDFAANNSSKKLPRPEGDLIGENLRGTDGYLYFTSSNYSWYDPKTFKPKAAATGMFHSR